MTRLLESALGRVVSSPHSLLRGSRHQMLETRLFHFFFVCLRGNLILILDRYVRCRVEVSFMWLLSVLRTIHVLRFVVTIGWTMLLTVHIRGGPHLWPVPPLPYHLAESSEFDLGSRRPLSG